MSDCMNDVSVMAGTDGTGEYIVIGISPKGRVGIRVLGDRIRVRVEPAGFFDLGGFFGSNWTTPSDSNRRFSTVAYVGTEAAKAIKTALTSIA